MSDYTILNAETDTVDRIRLTISKFGEMTARDVHRKWEELKQYWVKYDLPCVLFIIPDVNTVSRLCMIDKKLQRRYENGKTYYFIKE